MTAALRALGPAGLVRLADALNSGRLAPPFSLAAVRKYAPAGGEADLAAALNALAGDGMAPRHVATLARLLAEERVATQAVSDRLDLVWSGLEVERGTMSRDTASVVQAMFRDARASLLVASYTVDTGAKAGRLFGELGRRMDAEAGLSVRMFLHVSRWRDERADSELLREFAERFRDEVWPGERLPEVFYDPRSLALPRGGGGGDARGRASLHAKCIVADDTEAFISSANFTEAAHERNIEAGVMIRDHQIARALRLQFDTLLDRGLMLRVPGLTTRRS